MKNCKIGFNSLITNNLQLNIKNAICNYNRFFNCVTVEDTAGAPYLFDLQRHAVVTTAMFCETNSYDTPDT